MKIPLLALIFQGIPETIALATLAFVIAKIPLQWKKIVLIGIILAFSSFILRMLPITFGIHTVFSIGLLFILLTKIGGGNVNISLLTSLFCYLAIIIIETVCLSILMPLFGASLESMTTDALIRIIVGLPQVFVLIILTYVIYKFRNKKKETV